MKIEVWCIGKTSEKWIEEGVLSYQKKQNNLFSIQWVYFNDIKDASKMSAEILMKKEAQLVEQKLSQNDILILFDKEGTQYTSEQLALFFEQQLQLGNKRIVFLIGGAFGFTPEIKQKAHLKLSFSNLTFSHQMFRILIAEQFYRAFSIIHHLPYHK